MITEVPLEYAGDRRHREADERPLVRIEAPTCLNESGAGNLEEVLVILAAMGEPPGQCFGQPQMGRDDLVEDLLSLRRTCRLGSEQKFGSSF